MIKINHHAITTALENILRRLGIGPAEFQLPPRPDDVFNKGEEGLTKLTRLFHEESGLLIRNGRPVFVYIPDHTRGWTRDNRVHFTVCEQLEKMESTGRLDSRYRVTERDDNRYRIDIGEGEDDEKKLLPCQFCLFKSRYPGFPNFMWGAKWKRDKVIDNFDAKEAFEFLRHCFEEFRPVADTLRSATIPTGYSSNWREIARKTREARNYTCEKCKVHLEEHRHLLDVHHIDGDKSNNQDSNLRVLCKLDHAEKHEHYRISEFACQAILKARREQGIFP